MVGDIVENNSEIGKLSKDLKNEIIKLSDALALLEKDIALLQKGDENGSYWKGKKAYVSIEKCLGQIDSDRNLIDNLNKCLLYLDSLSQKVEN